MREPWDVFLELYQESLAGDSHGEAVVEALFGLLVHLDRKGWSGYGGRSAVLKQVADAWHEEGGEDAEELRRRLARAWSEAGPPSEGG